jgi:hypothetical protein
LWPIGTIGRHAVVAAVAALMLVACGDSNDAATTTSRSVTTTKSTETSATGTTATGQDVAADREAAEAAALKLSDFPPGWTSAPHEESADVPNVDAQLAKCLGVDESELNSEDGPASVDSPDFSDVNDNAVSNSVEYLAAESDAQHRFALFADEKVPDCLTDAIAKVLDYFLEHPENPEDTVPPGVTVGTPTVEPLSMPAIGDQTVAYRLTVPITSDVISVTAYVDIIVAIKGRAAVEMTFESLATPFPVEDAQHYMELVVGRLTDT